MLRASLTIRYDHDVDRADIVQSIRCRFTSPLDDGALTSVTTMFVELPF